MKEIDDEEIYMITEEEMKKIKETADKVLKEMGY